MNMRRQRIFYYDGKSGRKPLAHQQKAIEAFRASEQKSLLIRFFTGLGKSYTALCCAATTDVKKILIIAPTGLHAQWADECKFVPFACEVHVVGGREGHSYDWQRFNSTECVHIVSVNVDTFSHDFCASVIEWAQDAAVILDEATSIKNYNGSKRGHSGTIRAANIVSLNSRPCKINLALTATPITEAVGGLWAILEFLNRNWRNYYSFINTYSYVVTLRYPTMLRPVKTAVTRSLFEKIRSSDYLSLQNTISMSYPDYLELTAPNFEWRGNIRRLPDLLAHLDSFVVSASYSDVGIDMPPISRITRTVEMSEEQQKHYQTLLQSDCLTLDNVFASCVNTMVRNIRLQQISSGFILGYDEQEMRNLIQQSTASGKMPSANECIKCLRKVGRVKDVPKLEALMHDIIGFGDKCIVFVMFTAESELICERLEKEGIEYAVNTGSRHEVDKFKNNPDCRVLVANLSATAFGYNLIEASAIFYYSVGYSALLRIQSEGRIYRIGQERHVLYVDYDSSPIEHTILERVSEKRNAFREVIGQSDIDSVVQNDDIATIVGDINE